MPVEPTVKTLYLVDGTAQLFRAYFAIPGLTNPEGLPTNAVYGFTTMLRKLMSEEKPDHMAVAFDLPGPTFRHDRYAEYKANRPETPEDLDLQVPYAKQVCEALRVPVLELAGFEADDMIATYARLARREGFEVVIVASDKDLLQLVDAGIKVLNPVKNVTLDPEGVEKSFGVPPGRVRDVLGLMGDSVDNIPGVPGVGEKTALAMVRAYGGLEEVLERAVRFVAAYDARDLLLDALAAIAKEEALSAKNAARLASALEGFSRALEELCGKEADPGFRGRLETVRESLKAQPPDGIPGRAGERGKEVARDLRELKRQLKDMEKGSARRIWYAVHENAETARLSRELATLNHEAPVSFDPQAVAVGPPDRERARELFTTLNFRKLLEEVGREAPGGKESEVGGSAGAGAIEYRRLEELEGLAEVVRACREAGRFALATVADGPDPMRARLVGLALAHTPESAAYLPLEGEGEPGFPAEAVRESLGPLLADPSVEKIARNLKHHLHLLERHGLPVEGWGTDPMVASFLLDPGATGVRQASSPEGGGDTRQPRLDGEQEQRGVAAAGGAAASLDLAAALESRLEEDGLQELYRSVDGPLLPVLARMESLGIRVDSGKLEAMSREMEQGLDRIREEIHALAGVEFNVDSPKQLREVLFDRMGLTPRRKTAKGKVSSTDARTLEELAGEHAIAQKVLEYREMAKLKGTYADSLPTLIHPETGRIHTTYHPTGAATGRLSSSDPNLQNIPARSEAGLRIRSAFVPEPGFVFLASDYSQVELRILAHLSSDPELLAAFREGEDIHRRTASRVYGVLPDLVDETMRRRAKAVNFGLIYGMSETRLAAEQGMTRMEARRFIQAYFERFGGVKRYIEQTRERARRDAAVRTLMGRVRYFPQLHTKAGRAVHEQAMRAAVNTTVQGTAADLMKMAMLRVDRRLAGAGSGARMLLQVHDELLFEVPEGEVERTGPLIREAMEEVYRLEVPLLVDQKIGRSWQEVT